MSENLTKMVQKIDFNKIVENNETDGVVEDIGSDTTSNNNNNEIDGKELATFQPSLWPWDSVRNKLK
jgi:mediator of RNA polymerase II transcription subunit 17